MTQSEAQRLLEAMYPEHRERAPGAARLLRRWVDGEPVGRLVAEACRASAPTEPPPSGDDDRMPDTQPTGAWGRPGQP